MRSCPFFVLELMSGSRAFTAFLILVASAILWMLPVTEGIYDFRTDVEENAFAVTTGVGETAANVTLLTALYDDDYSEAAVTSNITSDIPAMSSYNTTTRALAVNGLTANTSRTITVEYDVYALTDANAVDTFLDWFPYIWILIKIAFPIAALAAIFVGRG